MRGIARDPAGLGRAHGERPPALRTHGLVEVGLAGTIRGWRDPARGPGKGCSLGAGGASGLRAFLRIGLPAKAVAPPLPSCPASALAGSRNQSPPPSCAGAWPAAGRVPTPSPPGRHWRFPVSRDHFTDEETDVSSAPFSPDGTRLTACFPTRGPVDCTQRLQCPQPPAGPDERPSPAPCSLIDGPQ